MKITKAYIVVVKKTFRYPNVTIPEVKKEYDALVPVYEVRKKLIRMRMSKGLTQAEITQSPEQNIP